MPLRYLVLAAAALAVVACQAPSTAPTPPPAALATATPAISPLPYTATRVELLNSAAAAYAAGDTVTAAGLYERVLNTPPSPAESTDQRAAIDQLANFRALLALLNDQRDEDAQDRMDALHETPNAPLSRLADQLYDQYGMTGGVRGACAQLQPQIASQATGVLTTLQGVGVGIDATSLCTTPG
jgi:hypothetical protein